MENNIEYNKTLIEKYPFLLPRNRWTDEVVEDYDYTWTELDTMPTGWRNAFGEQMCDEILKELEKVDYVSKYRIIQIKEKYGGLRWYDNGYPIGKLSDVVESTIVDSWKNAPHTDDNNFWYPLKQTKDGKIIYECKRIIEKCRIDEIIKKYENLSERTCIVCGKSAEYISKGWISPYCEEHIGNKDYAVPVEECFKEG